MIDFDEQTILAGIQRIGKASFEITDGKSLIIETSPSGAEILNESVPAGKKWLVDIWLKIREVDLTVG